jgi:hypothetical protein
MSGKWPFYVRPYKAQDVSLGGPTYVRHDIKKHNILFTSDLLLHSPFSQDSNHGYRKRVRGDALSFHDIEALFAQKKLCLGTSDIK